MSPETALYALIGLGYEDVSNEQLENRDSMFAQYGGGVKYWVTDNFALKAEVRHAIKAHGGDNNMFYSLGFTIPFDAKTAPAVAKAAPVAAPVVAAVVAPAPAPAPAPNICAAGRFPAASGPKELLPSCGSRRSGSPCRNAPAPAVLRSGRHASCRQVHLIYRTR